MCFVFVVVRVVEFVHFRADDDRIVIILAEVYLRFFNGDRTFWGQVFDQILRLPFRRNFVHIADRNSVTVGVAQVFVDPRLGLIRQALLGQLASRNENLLVFSVYFVAVDVNVVKKVVRAECLQLIVDVVEWPGVVNANVVDRQLVSVQHVL